MAESISEKKPLLDDSSSPSDLYDIVIIGAGISGINAAYRIQTAMPNARYAILEARHGMGGTWDFFKYPGLRSDSDLHTFGFPWAPWSEQSVIVDGPSIRRYIINTAATHGIDKHVRYGQKLKAADWSSEQQRWNLSVQECSEDAASGEEKEEPRHTTYTTRFIFFATGYYNYDEPLQTEIPGLGNFGGTVVHPQFWPSDLDYTDKNIVVIGSGATAITLLPVLSEKAKHATMLQRSPSYIMSIPQPAGRDESFLYRLLPTWLYLKFQRFKFIILTQILFDFCRTFPNAAKKVLRKGTMRQLPQNVSYEEHFVPSYNPWQQRLCFCPDGDFFAALHTGRASVSTGKISTMSATTITLTSGETIDADIIVTATGLKIHLAGGCKASVDGQNVLVKDKFMWNGVMLQDIPNAAVVVGYTNASWTLGSDATAVHIARLLKHMKKNNYTVAVPRVADESSLEPKSMIEMNSTYFQKGKHHFPKAATQKPWRPRKGYFWDMYEAKYGSLNEGMEFRRAPAAAAGVKS